MACDRRNASKAHDFAHFKFLIARRSPVTAISAEHGLRSDHGMHKLGPSLKIGGAANLIRVVMSGALNEVKGLGRWRRLEDLPAQGKWNDVILIAVDHQFR